jgi:putative hydrolase of the HAD superfamily
MRHPIDRVDKSINKQCIIGFDIWGTLLDLNKVLETIAYTIAEKLNLDRALTVKRVFEVHDEAKKIRRFKPDISPSEVFEVSRRLLADSFNMKLKEVEDVIETAFKGASKDIVYGDTIPALIKLSNMGISMGTVGNVLFWPSTYTRILLRELGLMNYFEVTVFSDEVGLIKPDRRIYLKFAELMGSEPSDLIYVGDNVVEDVGGALSAGGFGVLISRKTSRKLIVPELKVALITDLNDLVEVYNVFCKQ